MPNHDEHAKAAAIVGAVFEFFHAAHHGRPVTPKNLLIAAGAGYLGSRAPDVIEPPVHPHHRDLAHSVTVGAGVVYAVTQVDGDSELDVAKRAFGVGYATHLVQDAETPRSIPLLMRSRRR
jgi:hypothetical protein